MSVKLTNGALHQRMVAPAAAPGAGASIGGAASSTQQTGASAHAIQGTGNLTGLHNTPLHVGMIVVAAAAGLALMRIAGFRFAFDAGFGKT